MRSNSQAPAKIHEPKMKTDPQGELERYLRSKKDPKEFALENRNLIPRGIRKWGLDRIPGVSREDAEQECIISLFKSAETWDPELGSFATHAIHGMRRCKRILEENNAALRFNPHLRNRIGKYLRWHASNPSSPIEEFASYIEVSVSEASEISEAALCLLNSRRPKDGSALFYGEKPAYEKSDGSASPYVSLGDVDRKRVKMERFRNAHTSCEIASLHARVFAMMGALPEKERKIVSLHFGLDKEDPISIRQIANDMGITKEKANHLFRRALRKLRDAAEEAGMRKDLLESIPD